MKKIRKTKRKKKILLRNSREGEISEEDRKENKRN